MDILFEKTKVNILCWSIEDTVSLFFIPSFVEEYYRLGRELEIYELVWFDITKKGEKVYEYLSTLPELENNDPFYDDEI